jgi:hypothetical protein
MNKQRKTSHILNVFQYDADGHVVLPASLTLSIAPGTGDNNSKVPTTAWVRTYVSGLSYATSASVTSAIAALVDAAPSTLDTLNELAAALGDDPNFATTIATSIGGKLALTGGTLTGDLTLSGINPRLYFTDTDNNPDYFISNTDGTFTVYDVTNSVGRFKIYTTGNAEFTNNLTAASFIKSGGTAAQFLKADGSVDGNTYLTGITSSQVTTALGYTPYNATNPSGYITGITSANVTTALGYTPYNSTNPSGYITGITSANVTTALGYTPYNSTNPSGYITSSGTAAAISQTVAGGSEANLVYATIGDNDFFRIRVGGASNAGWAEIATADDGTEPIYVRQYTGVFSSVTRTATLLDGSGNTSFPGTVTAPTFSGSLSGNASTASSVAWTNVSGRPTAVSSFTNDSGYITSSYVSWGNISSRPSWMTSASLVATHSNANDWQNSGFYENGGGGSNWPSQTWYNSINVRHSNQGNYHGFQVAMSYYDNLLWFRSYQGSGSFQSWAYAISSANIGSQSVSYASSAGNADTVDGYHYDNFPGKNGNSYYQVATWLQLTGTHGLYCPSVNNAHFYPQNLSYGSWRVEGSKNGWSGIHFGGGTGMTLMMNETEFGFHREGHGWYARFTSGRFYGACDNVYNLDYALGNAHNWTGTNQFLRNNGGQSVNNSNTAALQAYSTGNNSAFMSFHKGGHYAINMGLDDDNVFRIGGWSASGNRFQMDMSGNLTMAGDVTAYSDARVKENIVTVDDALNKVLALRGVYYNRIDSDDKKTKIGVIAQETLQVVPEVVNQDNDGMFNVSYGNLAGLFIEAFKEQQKQIEELKSIINGLTR